MMPLNKRFQTIHTSIFAPDSLETLICLSLALYTVHVGIGKEGRGDCREGEIMKHVGGNRKSGREQEKWEGIGKVGGNRKSGR